MNRVDFRWLPPGALALPTAASARFVGPAEVVQLALCAFYAASRDQEPPPGEPWLIDGANAWSGPEDFMDGLLRHIDARLRAAALATGFAIEQPWTDEETAEHDALLEAMAHGCAVLDLGAGAPPTAQPDRSGASYEEPLLHVQPGQELPQPGIAAMIDPAREVEA